MLCARLSAWWSDQLHPPPCVCSGCHRKSGVVFWESGWCTESLSFKIVRVRRGERERERKRERIVGKGFFLFIYLRYAQVRHSSFVRGVVMWGE